MKRFLVIMVAAACMLATSCGTVQKTSASFYDTKTQYLNNEADGSITVRATGIGRNRFDAIDQARKNALRDMIFNGIEVPGNTVISKPLVMTVNAQEKYEDFFNAFFADGGDYENFVSAADRKIISNRKDRNKIQAKVTITTRLLRPELKAYLQEAQIIK